jgi:hypothetical protein
VVLVLGAGTDVLGGTGVKQSKSGKGWSWCRDVVLACGARYIRERKGGVLVLVLVRSKSIGYWRGTREVLG